MELLDFDPVTGVSTTMAIDDGKTIIKTSQDVEPILDRNQQLLSNQQSGWRGDMHHVASIPIVIMEQWWRELGDNPMLPRNRAWLVAKLNNSDWLKLRTKDGVI
jgi:hypothetical protein